MATNQSSCRLLGGRFLISLVTFTNIQCAIIFFLFPEKYIRAYELTGIPGEIAIQGFGILFIMWNVPYGLAIIHPQKHRTSLYEAILMQFIGLLGESYLFITLPPGFTNLSVSIARFMIFDGIGLIILLTAMRITNQRNN